MIYTEPKPRAIFDIECLHDYFLICFKDIKTGRRKSFEMFDGHPLDRAGLIRILRHFTLVGFNSNEYDNQMLKYALKIGVTPAMLKKLNDAIIVRRMKPWDAEREFNLPAIPWMDTIDVIEPAPSVMVSLKLYGGRLHSKRLQDLPFDPDERVFDAPDPLIKRQEIISYCNNDLDTTEDVYRHIEPQITLRCQMSDQYGVDLRSKSDAQIAEAVIRSEIERITGDKIYRPELPANYTFQYQPPGFVQFKTQALRDVLRTVCDATFALSKKPVKDDDDGDDAVSDGGVKVKISGIAMPKEIKALKIAIGKSVYKMGIGGLHSTEKRTAHYSTKRVKLRDADVAAFYPMLILICELYPEHLGRTFLDVYRKIRERRMGAKDRIKALKELSSLAEAAVESARLSGDIQAATVIDMTLKIVLNGTFGKLGSKWSFLFSPNLMIQVTITGQLSLLMLIEDLELAGISVISANTDGIVAKFTVDQESAYHKIVKEWEQSTGFEMEFTDYRALYSASVNSYIAIKTDGKVKQKGLFAFVGSKGSPAEKNPTNYVCIDAVINYLTKNIPLEETIEWCPDVRRFLTVRRAKGGAVDTYDDKYLGKAIRWYYSKNRRTSHIIDAKSGNKVAKSDGAMPMMELGGLPDDIDYTHYVNESRKMLGELGVL